MNLHNYENYAINHMNEHALTNQIINLLIGTNPNSSSSDTIIG